MPIPTLSSEPETTNANGPETVSPSEDTSLLKKIFDEPIGNLINRYV